MSRRDYGSEVYSNGGQLQGLLKPNANLTDPQRLQAQNAFREAKKSSQNIVMPFGFDYVKMGFNPEEVEFLQAGNFSVATIARWFGVPPHKLFDLSRATFSNIEHMAIEFLQDTIAPILVKIEAEYTSKLFQLNSERKYYIEFNMNAYVRADIQARFNAYSTGVHAALIKPKEAREWENLEFVPESDRLFINQGSAPVDLIDQIVLKKQPVSNSAKEKLKAKFNGQTQEILDILNGD
jgi:HK97 family phage portal protein